jgi:hypothetical protein
LVLIAILTVAFGPTASANLWETQAKIEKRYGPPIRIKGYPDRRSFTYAFENWQIRIRFFDGLSGEENYFHPGDETRLSDSEIDRILETNSGGAKWRTEDRREWTIDAPMGRAHAMLQDGGELDVYTAESLKRMEATDFALDRTHSDETLQGVVSLKRYDGHLSAVVRTGDRIIEIPWYHLEEAKYQNPMPGRYYAVTLRDEYGQDEEDVVAFVTDRDHKTFRELTEDSKSYVLMPIQDGDDVVFDRSTCEVHHLEMTETTVEIQYGMWGPSDVEWHCVRNFPHHRKYIQGGCNVDEEHKVGKRFICPKCVEECERYTASVSPK